MGFMVQGSKCRGSGALAVFALLEGVAEEHAFPAPLRAHLVAVFWFKA